MVSLEVFSRSLSLSPNFPWIPSESRYCFFLLLPEISSMIYLEDWEILPISPSSSGSRNFFSRDFWEFLQELLLIFLM